MKVLASLDSDGHFDVTPINDRKAIIDILERAMDGDFWANEVEHNLLFVNAWSTMSDEQFEEELRGFSQRGLQQIVEIK